MIRSTLLVLLPTIALVACGPEHSRPLSSRARVVDVERFALVPGWGLQDDQGIGPTHGGVVVDRSGSVIVSADRGVYVFDAEGRIQRRLEEEPFRHLHAMTIAQEGGREFLYGAAYKASAVVKFTLEGEVVMRIPFPEESGVQGRYVPTAVAVAPSGNILVADGYGTNVIFEFSPDGRYLRHFGGKDRDDPQKFHTPHGLAIDDRVDPPRLLISDREKRRLVHFTLDGEFIEEVIGGLRRPCCVSLSGSYVAIAELEGRVAILDGENALVGVLGDNPDESQWANYGVKPEDWKPSTFTAPHGVAWGGDGHLYVQDWNATGRVTKWRYDG